MEMSMQIDIAKISVQETYQWMVSLVTPRPIAWVTSVSPEGVVNLAPFSFFNTFGANPPVVVFSPTLTRTGGKKDTLLNIEQSREFIIHAATERDVENVNASSATMPRDKSEVEFLGLETVPGVRVGVPRLAGSSFAMECRLIQIVPIGEGPVSANLVIGEVLMLHVDPGILGEDGKVDPRKLQAVARLGGDDWCRSRDLFQMQRPG
jgi:flavin reductase (DIM6/NTAB) family NADH-FMN oxidoreductase RutF